MGEASAEPAAEGGAGEVDEGVSPVGGAPVDELLGEFEPDPQGEGQEQPAGSVGLGGAVEESEGGEAEAARQQDPAFPQLGDPDSTDALYQATSPCSQVAKWCTPTLFVHGSKDYRLPDVEGLAAFTALQRAGVKSKLLLFPKENHWVLRPTNSIKWHATVLQWLQSCAEAS